MLKPGDIVEVLTSAEIMKTLDSEGKLDGLPFMPEMIEYCGQLFKVKTIIDKTCVVNLSLNDMREFQYNDVVSLDNLRCSGRSHGGCQAGCTIFWKEAWLRKANVNDERQKTESKYQNELKKALKTKLDNDRYVCQSTDILLATIEITKSRKLSRLVHETYTGKISLFTFLREISNVIMRKLGINNSSTEVIKGNLKKTPTEILNLKPGEIVEVKSFDEILKTLDEHGKNKGLGFNGWMKEYCGKRVKVRGRVERMIDEVTGEMKEIRNTVILEDSVCMACARGRFNYWREIWLKRV